MVASPPRTRHGGKKRRARSARRMNREDTGIFPDRQREKEEEEEENRERTNGNAGDHVLLKVRLKSRWTKVEGGVSRCN